MRNLSAPCRRNTLSINLKTDFYGYIKDNNDSNADRIGIDGFQCGRLCPDQKFKRDIIIAVKATG